MFRFNLVKDRQFELEASDRETDGGERTRSGVYIRTVVLSEVEINQSGSNGECKEVSELKQKMELYRIGNAINEWQLRVDIGIEMTPRLGETPRDFIRILGFNGGNSILKGLREVAGAHGWRLKLCVEIKDFGCVAGGHVAVYTSEEGLRESFNGLALHDMFESHHVQYSREWDTRFWPQANFRGIITVSGTVSSVKTCVPKTMEVVPSPAEEPMAEPFPGSGPMSSRILQKMLEEGRYSDATIISAEGEEIKCHTFVLTEHSDVFETMFKETSKSAESITGTIQMDDMCSKSVKAFLAYLYLDDIGKAEKDSGVAVDLFKAAHKYHVPRLEGKMKQILASKPEEWFNVEGAMWLYFFAKNLEGGEGLKKKALIFLRKNHSALNELPAYIQLFDEEPHAGRLLCADLLAYL